VTDEDDQVPAPPDDDHRGRGGGGAAGRRGSGGASPWFGGDLLAELFANPLEPGYAAAARRRARHPESPGQRRLGVGLRVVSLALIGFLLITAYRQAVAAQPEAGRAKAKLVEDVQERRTETDGLQDRADRLRDDVARARDEALAGSGGLDRRLKDLETVTGLGKVQGDGAEVTLADGPPPVDPVTGKPAATNPGRVMDRDLQDIANALWSAGAEAVAVNGRRLSATSTIRAAGGSILVDFRPVSAPYAVTAIGPGDLDRRFADSATGKRFRRYADQYRMQFTVKRQTGLTLPAATEPRLRYARTVPSATPTPSTSPSGGGR